MNAQAELLLAAQHEALNNEAASAKEQVEAYRDIFKAAIAEGFCPMDGYRLTPGRVCQNPAFCGANGGATYWSLDGYASRFDGGTPWNG